MVALAGIPSPAADVSAAVVVADEYGAVLAYRIAFESSGTIENYAVVGVSSLVHRFGSPNDEALHGHPLADAGLRHYTPAEVVNSPWVAELERQNRVHPRHSSDHYESLRHIAFPFHDSTFESVCSHFHCATFDGAPEDLLPHMAALLKQ